jgi:hypothetical protein
LVSPYFIASDYCYDVEMKRALERHEAGEARVIPVILHPCDWKHSPFGKLLAVPQDGKPVSKYPNQHDAFHEVAIAVRQVLQELGHHSASTPARSTPAQPSQRHAAATGDPRSSNLRMRKEFSDSERDTFLDRAFEYIANFFEASLQELQARNTQAQTKFRRIDANHFSAIVYVHGATVSQCRIWLGSMMGRHQQILYSMDASGGDNSCNESLSVEDDGHALFLKPMGISSSAGDAKSQSEHGAAEYLWAILMRRVQ